MIKTIPYLYLFVAIVLEVVANTFLQRSHGMTKKLPGAIEIGFIIASFTMLSLAIKGIPMATAYAVWGGCGILLTAMYGWFFHKEILSKKAYLGLLMIILGLIFLEVG